MKTFRKALYILIAVIMVLASIVLPASAGSLSYGAGTVSASSLNMRSGPDTTYSVVTTLNEGAIVVILEKTSDSWYKINYNGKTGYASAKYFDYVLTKENFNATGTVNANSVYMRSIPSTSGKVLGTYKSGTSMPVIGINEGWYKVSYNGNTGYIRSDLMDITGGSSYVPASSSKPTNSSLGQQIADYSLQFAGCRYVWGGASPSGFDCSGFTQYVYKQFGISISRTASTQWKNNGYKVSKSELQPGDLVFFSQGNGGTGATHVGIYLGNGQFIHASSSTTGVIISSLSSSNNVASWFGAKRIV